MLNKVRLLFEGLNSHGIRYCHWKSNIALADSLWGLTDIDLLIHYTDIDCFRTILRQLCFKSVHINGIEAFPSVEHHIALDGESGTLIHVHAYFQVITGESLTKNYQFPIEEMLLKHTRQEGIVRVPTKSAELLVFTSRMMLKHTSLVELVLLARYWNEVKEEVTWLLEADPIEETLDLLKVWLPTIDPNLFSACIAALKDPAPLHRRIVLGRQLRSQLRPYARHGAFQVWLNSIRKFTVMLWGRLTRSKLAMVPQAGGLVIAFVGPEATGKSTLISEMKSWLGQHFTVRQIHAGKPKSTFLTAVPNLLLPALRKLFPNKRSTKVENKYTAKLEKEKMPVTYPLLFAIRSTLLAYERRSLLIRASSQAAKGTVVLSDRYPSSGAGGIDGPMLAHLPVAAKRYSLRRLLTGIETSLYHGISPPDLIVYLNAPLEVTLSRNEARDKTEPEEYVRSRHARSSNLTFEKSQVHQINTDQPFPQTVLEVKKAIWNALD